MATLIKTNPSGAADPHSSGEQKTYKSSLVPTACYYRYENTHKHTENCRNMLYFDSSYTEMRQCTESRQNYGLAVPVTTGEVGSQIGHADFLR